jgi:hypothetical protein
LGAGEGFSVFVLLFTLAREEREYISRCISFVGGTRKEGWWEREEEGKIRV